MINNEFEIQKKANIVSFEEDHEYRKRFEVLRKIHDSFKKNSIKWGLACSSSLFLYGIVDDFNDLDLLIEKNSVKKAQKALTEIGAELEQSEDSDCCKSNYFYEYTLDGVDVDFISGFRLVTFNTQYLYEYSKKEASEIVVDNMLISLVAPEAQFILYAMMEGWQPKRRYKRILIQKYLQETGIEFKEIFERELNKNLPGWVKKEIRNLLNLDQK